MKAIDDKEKIMDLGYHDYISNSLLFPQYILYPSY